MDEFNSALELERALQDADGSHPEAALAHRIQRAAAAEGASGWDRSAVLAEARRRAGTPVRRAIKRHLAVAAVFLLIGGGALTSAAHNAPEGSFLYPVRAVGATVKDAFKAAFGDAEDWPEDDNEIEDPDPSENVDGDDHDKGRGNDKHGEDPEDHDRGHGNDGRTRGSENVDGDDHDKGRGNDKRGEDPEDHDRGHGNDGRDRGDDDDDDGEGPSRGKPEKEGDDGSGKDKPEKVKSKDSKAKEPKAKPSKGKAKGKGKR